MNSISGQAREMVPLLRDFVRERCALHVGFEVGSLELLAAFDAWLESRGVHTTAKPRPVSAAMREIGFWPKKRSAMLWSGLRLRTDAAPVAPAAELPPGDPFAD